MSNGPHQIPDSMTIMFVPDKTSPHLRYDSPQNMKCGTSWSRVARRSTYANTNRNQSDIAFAKTTFLTVILSKQKLAYLKLRWQNYSPKLLSFLHESIKNVNMRATRGIHLVPCCIRTTAKETVAGYKLYSVRISDSHPSTRENGQTATYSRQGCNNVGKGI